MVLNRILGSSVTCGRGRSGGRTKKPSLSTIGIKFLTALFQQVHPVSSELLDSPTCQGRRSCSEQPPRILTEVGDRDLPEIHFGECHGAPAHGGLCRAIDRINEDTHPLIPAPCVSTAPPDFRVVLISTPSDPALTLSFG